MAGRQGISFYMLCRVALRVIAVGIKSWKEKRYDGNLRLLMVTQFYQNEEEKKIK